VVYRKDFKIAGQISDAKGLSFVSLVRQIETGLRKGFKEPDIIEGVMRAIVPGLPLRDYLEGRHDLSLVSLRKILRSHYQEKSATELYTEMVNSTQGKEDAQEFLLRLLSIKQKILFVSKEEGNEIYYDEKLVNPVFMNTFYIGLKEETIRREMKPKLETKLNDDELIQAMSTIVSRERDRKTRLGKDAVRVHQVSESECREKPAKSVKEGVLWTELQELKAEIAEIKSSRTNNAASGSGSERSTQQNRLGCDKCQREQKETRCTHCWICGSDEHFKAGCKQRRKNNLSGKGRGSLPGGQ
jgi:hypothetical protein